MKDLQPCWTFIPTLLELDPRRFYSPVVEQIGDVDR
jgi:hypothetical protein